MCTKYSLSQNRRLQFAFIHFNKILRTIMMQFYNQLEFHWQLENAILFKDERHKNPVTITGLWAEI